MLKRTILISTVVAMISVTAMARGHYSDNVNRGQSTTATSSYSRTTSISSLPLSDLTDAQKSDLLFMIEEEKLARDVYTYLYNLWGNYVFNSIARSEQKHIDAIEFLINRYGLDTPSTLNTQGVFENEELQSLYNTLIEKGQSSLIDALEVGVMVEETDISDLEDILDVGVPSDFETIYQNLLKGSYSHLNAFNRQLSIQ
ncbi:MAG: DUF2202 domain-containing protein [Epsilonproteobacteria bacterium]|nr:DUF2202 domain-containing protein [Campylobacterota bacterium]